MNYFFMILLILASCGGKIDVPSAPPSAFPALSRDWPLIFAKGVYLHRITVTDPDGKMREFKGILKLEEDRITIVGLSAFGTTMFKISERLSAKAISTKFYYPVPKAFRKKAVQLYGFMKPIFLMSTKRIVGGTERRSYDRKGLLKSFRDPVNRMEVLLREYDDKGLPRELELRFKDVSVSIYLEEYRAE